MFTSSMHIRRRDMLVGLGCLAATPALAKAPLSGGLDHHKQAHGQGFRTIRPERSGFHPDRHDQIRSTRRLASLIRTRSDESTHSLSR